MRKADAPPFSRSREGGDFDFLSVTKAHAKKTGTDQHGAVCPVLAVPFSRETNLPDLLHQNLAIGIESSLHANALAFELRNVALVVDVIGLARIIFQHILVALLHNCS